jgi:uncharacterized protein
MMLTARTWAVTYPDSALQDIHFNQVKIDDPFWSERIRSVQEATIPDLLNLAEEEGKLNNFRIVAGRKKGKIGLYNAPDSDVYKVIQDAAYSLAWRRDSPLEKRLDAIIDDIAAAQQPDGYLNTQYTLPFDDPASPPATNQHVRVFGYGPEWRWKSTMKTWPKGYSQLYCAGHLMEAAVAYDRATGKRKLLEAAIRNANDIASVFTLEKIKSYADHPEVEIGLMKLYEVTGDPRYLDLADEFCRYIGFSRPVDLGRGENAKPLAEQRQAYGHCVRTAYIYAGATDVVRAKGAGDLRTALDALWQDVTGRKMYIDGGTGNGAPAEQHGEDFDLPISPTYSETCAAVAEGQWNHRLNLLSGDARYVDVVELEMWNNALAGISLGGTNYFYANKLNIGTMGRKNEQSGVRRRYLFCCPSKVPGFITGLGRWIYATDGDGLVVNLFVGSEVRCLVAGHEVKLRQESKMPWDGQGNLTVEECGPTPFALKIREPGWIGGSGPTPCGLYSFGPGERPELTLSLNGHRESATPDAHGYVVFKRVWKPGDRIEWRAAMPVRRVYTDERVAANRGRVALMRGPVLYCLEGVDNDFDVLQMELPKSNHLTTAYRPGLLGGVTVLLGEGVMPDGKKVHFTAIPYYAWNNRGIYALATLVIENRAGLTPEKPALKGMNTNG